MNAKAYLENFIADVQFRYSTSTLDNYQRYVNQFFNYCNKPLDEIRKRDIRNWLIHNSEKGYQPATICLGLCSLKTFFTYCLEEELILQNPAEEIDFPKRDEVIPKYLTVEQLTLLRGHVEGQVRARAVIETLYATGIRISELAAMRIEDINWSERSILITNGKGKKERMVLFTRVCGEHLKFYLDKRTDTLPFVFPNSKGTKSFSFWYNKNMFLDFSEQLGFKVTSHILRHTFAAHLAQKGMPLNSIQVLLGHTDIQNTQIYARLYDLARKEIYDDLM